MAASGGVAHAVPNRLRLIRDRRRGRSVDNSRGRCSVTHAAELHRPSIAWIRCLQVTRSHLRRRTGIVRSSTTRQLNGTMLDPNGARKRRRKPALRWSPWWLRPVALRAELPTLRPPRLSFDWRPAPWTKREQYGACLSRSREGPGTVLGDRSSDVTVVVVASPGRLGRGYPPFAHRAFCFVGDRHRGQSVDNPVNAVPLIKRGRFSSRRGSVLIPLDRRFVRWGGSRGGFAGHVGRSCPPFAHRASCLDGDRHRGRSVDNSVGRCSRGSRGRYSGSSTTWCSTVPASLSGTVGAC